MPRGQRSAGSILLLLPARWRRVPSATLGLRWSSLVPEPRVVKSSAVRRIKRSFPLSTSLRRKERTLLKLDEYLGKQKKCSVCFFFSMRDRKRSSNWEESHYPPNFKTSSDWGEGCRLCGGGGVKGQGVEGLCRMPCRSSGKARMTASMWALSLTTVPGRTGSCSLSAWVCSANHQQHLKLSSYTCVCVCLCVCAYICILTGGSTVSSIMSSCWRLAWHPWSGHYWRDSAASRYTVNHNVGTSLSFSFRTRSTVSTSECCWTLCCRSYRHRDIKTEI